MKYIHLSHSSQSVFRIIRDLYEADKENCLEDMIRRVGDTEIETTDDNVFLLSEEGFDDSESDDYIFTAEGATWFQALRDTTSVNEDNGNRIWIKFIEDVSQRFHDKYAFLEYFHDKNQAQQANESTDRNIINAAAAMLGLNHDNIVKTSEDISYIFFGVTLKLVLTKNGFFQPVLAKMLFSNGRPMRQDVASRIIRSLTTQEGTSESKLKRRAKNNDSRDYKLEEINSLLTSFFEELKEGGNLMDYLILASDEDVKAIHDLEGYDTSPIVCDNVKMLNLFYADWPSRGYDVMSEDAVLYRFTFGPGNMLSLDCHCGERIISDNTLYLHETDEDGEVFTTEIELDLDAYSQQFGLNAEELKYLSAHSPSREHALPVFCPENIRQVGGCKRYHCLGDTVTFNGAPRLYCKDCPYVEVISYIDNQPVLTASLVYSTNNRRLVSADSVSTCEICSRPFDNLSSEGVCNLCSSLRDDNTTPGSTEEKRAKHLYHAYAHMLPLTRRLFSKKPHYCAEDEQLVVFRLGEQSYLYDKESGTFKRANS